MRNKNDETLLPEELILAQGLAGCLHNLGIVSQFQVTNQVRFRNIENPSAEIQPS